METIYYVVIKLFEGNELIEEGVIVNLPSKRRKHFKSISNAQKFINRFDRQLKKQYTAKYEIFSKEALNDYLSQK